MTTSPAFADHVPGLMKSRRVCRSFADQLVSDKHLRMLTDLDVAARESLQMEHDQANWMDVGTPAMNMMK